MNIVVVFLIVKVLFCVIPRIQGQAHQVWVPIPDADKPKQQIENEMNAQLNSYKSQLDAANKQRQDELDQWKAAEAVRTGNKKAFIEVIRKTAAEFKQMKEAAAAADAAKVKQQKAQIDQKNAQMKEVYSMGVASSSDLTASDSGL